MNAVTLARALGWFSLVLGAMEVAIPGTVRRRLGLSHGPGLVRAFGLREIAAGAVVLARPGHAAGPAARVAGDAMDIAVLAQALGPANSRRGAAGVALVLVLGVTALDVLCTSALAASARRT